MNELTPSQRDLLL